MSMRDRGWAMRCWASAVAVAMAVAAFAVGPGAGLIHAQGGAAQAAGGWSAPQTPWGDPDLQGQWTNMPQAQTPFERPDDLAARGITDPRNAEALREAQAIADDPESRQQFEQQIDEAGGRGTGAGPVHWYENLAPEKSRLWFVVDPPDGKVPPLTPEAQQRAAARAAARAGLGDDEPRPGRWTEDLSPLVRCITRGLPAVYVPGAYNNNYQIVQSPGYVTILYEWMHETRVIPLDGRPHLPSNVRQWIGDPRGRWEGDTLVVETTNFTNKTDYLAGFSSREVLQDIAAEGAAGKPEYRADETLTLVERFTPIGPNTIDWSVTIEKPETWTRPWTFSMPLTRDGTQAWIYEFACHEGNYGIAHILSGARAQEQAAQEAGAQR